MDHPTNIKHRNVLRHHYTRTSNVLLFGYRGVSDSAKITYQAIDSFDWTLNGGARKGYAYPKLGRVADLLGTTERTIRRHLRELEGAGLITRQERPGYPSPLVIEDPSADQAEQYLRTVAPDPEEGEPGGRDGDDDRSETPDKSVRRPRTEMSAPSIQEDQRERSQKNVEQALVEQRRRQGSDSTHISTTLQRRRVELSARRTAAADQRAEVLADEMCAALGDEASRTYFRSLARTTPAHQIYEAIAQVREAWRDGRVRKTRGALFTSLLASRGQRRPAGGPTGPLTAGQPRD